MDGCDESRLGKLSSFSFEEKLTFIVCSPLYYDILCYGVIFLKKSNFLDNRVKINGILYDCNQY